MKSLHLIVATALVFGFSCFARALDDTPENRGNEADRYLKAVPAQEMFAEMVDQMVQQMPEAHRANFKQAITKNFDVKALTTAMKDSMVKRFTADELAALADFYGSPVGKSAMKKFPEYLSDLMPTIQDQVMKAHSAIKPTTTEPATTGTAGAAAGCPAMK